MVSNFGFGRQQVPCYLSDFMAFKCYYCHVFVMCSFNTWMKLLLSTGPNPLWKLHFLRNLESLFIIFLNLLQRDERLIHVLHNHPSEIVRTLMMRFLKQRCCWEKTGKSLLSLDLNKMDNGLKHDREMEIGESTSKTLKKLRQEQKKSHNGHVQFLSHCHNVSD